MRKAMVAVTALALLSSACIFGGAQTRTVLADYSNDQFASAYLGFFPDEVQVHPGDTVVFKQTWTGEPHTITMGTIVEPLAKAMSRFLPAYIKGGMNAPGMPRDEPKDIKAIASKIPSLADENTGKVTQNGAQPCFLDTGTPPTDKNTPCKQRTQPAFTGRQAFYNSGYIHYEGTSGNTYRVPIAANATPGRYFFYCTFHGPLMSGFLDIRPKGSHIPSQAAVSRAASSKIAQWSKPLEDAWKIAQEGKIVPPPEAHLLAPGQKYFKGLLGGYGIAGDVSPQWESFIVEFIPRHTTAKVGEKVTWVMGGSHTLSFDVPKYFPIFTVRKDGTVERNPKIDDPQGGAPPLPKQDQSHTGPPPPPQTIDGGTWDGTHFWSSGSIQSDFTQYSLRFSKPGMYPYACLVHPAMVGTITITP